MDPNSFATKAANIFKEHEQQRATIQAQRKKIEELEIRVKEIEELKATNRDLSRIIKEHKYSDNIRAAEQQARQEAFDELLGENYNLNESLNAAIGEEAQEQILHLQERNRELLEKIEGLEDRLRSENRDHSPGRGMTTVESAKSDHYNPQRRPTDREPKDREKSHEPPNTPLRQSGIREHGLPSSRKRRNRAKTGNRNQQRHFPDPNILVRDEVEYSRLGDGGGTKKFCDYCGAPGHSGEECPEDPQELEESVGTPIENVVSGFECFNCWISSEHLARDCPKPKLNNGEREKLRVKLGIPMSLSWEKQRAAWRRFLWGVSHRQKLGVPADGIRKDTLKAPIKAAKPPVSCGGALANGGQRNRGTNILLSEEASTTKTSSVENPKVHREGGKKDCSDMLDSHVNDALPSGRMTKTSAASSNKGNSASIQDTTVHIVETRNGLLDNHQVLLREEEDTAEDEPTWISELEPVVTEKCWNCWSTGHGHRECPDPMRTYPEAEALRIELGEPKPIEPEYVIILAGLTCQNCWSSLDHATCDCSLPRKSIREREALRSKKGVPFSPPWREVLGTWEMSSPGADGVGGADENSEKTNIDCDKANAPAETAKATEFLLDEPINYPQSSNILEPMKVLEPERVKDDFDKLINFGWNTPKETFNEIEQNRTLAGTANAKNDRPDGTNRESGSTGYTIEQPPRFGNFTQPPSRIISPNACDSLISDRFLETDRFAEENMVKAIEVEEGSSDEELTFVFKGSSSTANENGKERSIVENPILADVEPETAPDVASAVGLNLPSRRSRWAVGG